MTLARPVPDDKVEAIGVGATKEVADKVPVLFSPPSSVAFAISMVFESTSSKTPFAAIAD